MALIAEQLDEAMQQQPATVKGVPAEPLASLSLKASNGSPASPSPLAVSQTVNELPRLAVDDSNNDTRALRNTTSEPLPPTRPSIAAKFESEAAPRFQRGSYGGLQRFATASLVPTQRVGQSHQAGGSSEDSDATSDSSSEDEQGSRGTDKARSKQGTKRHDKYSRFHLGNDYFTTTGKVRRLDGRLNISVNEKDSTGYLAKALGTGFRHHFFPSQEDEETGETATPQPDKVGRLPSGLDEVRNVPRMNIVIIVIGSRGDIQPFLKVGRILHSEYGHRVRIATHPAFKDFVEKDGNLEFFSVGGDPSELMAFMVKNPGLIPSIDTIKAGDIGRRREQMAEMFEGMWRACINTTDDEHDKANMKMMGDKDPFIADAIIANPPSFAHAHIAERLGIPLHLMFTFPWTPTTQFPHPLANIQSTNVDHQYANFMSYPLVELMTWQGLGDLINKFRVNTLGLEPVSTLWAPGQIYRLKVPFTYMWSPGLVPKPQDYGSNIDVCGFVFLELASSFKPPDELQKFLDAGEAPVYIGFGSIVVDDPNSFTKMVFDAVKMAGVRALVSKGWGGLGGGDIDIPEDIFLLDNTPHDWLFPRVSAVVHHGGAGTTAMGLKCGKPTMIVPFFGDQPFWGAMIAKQRAGAFECIPYKKLDAEKLAEGIKQCLTDEAKENVGKIADSIAREGDGASNAVKSFHKHLNLEGRGSIRCSILPNRVAVWTIKNLGLHLSALAADMLVEQKKLRWQDLRLVRHNEWNDFEGPGGPITGVVGPVLSTVMDASMGIASIPIDATHSIKHRKQHKAKKRRLEERRKKLAEVNSNIEGANGTAMSRTPTRPGALQRQLTGMSTLSADPTEHVAEELAKTTGHGFAKTGKAFLTLPMNIAVGLAQGFHNAPRLYGDETVRKTPRVSGFHSGLRAGRDEFAYGIYDGFTGLATQPYRGAKQHGAIGALEGTAIGLGGFVLKNLAAIFGPLGYPLKGIEKEISKTKQPTKFIRKAHILQGSKELRVLEHTSQKSRDEVLKTLKSEIFCPRPGEDLESLRRTVNDGWKIILELLDAVEKRRNEGPLKIKGKMALKLAEKRWHEEGALESVHSAKVALEAYKAGKSIGEELRKWRDEQERKPVAA